MKLKHVFKVANFIVTLSLLKNQLSINIAGKIGTHFRPIITDNFGVVIKSIIIWKNTTNKMPEMQSISKVMMDNIGYKLTKEDFAYLNVLTDHIIAWNKDNKKEEIKEPIGKPSAAPNS